MDRGLTNLERVELEHWLKGDPRRLGALARARAAWFHAERAGALGIMPTAEADGGRLRFPARRSFLIGGAAVAAGVAAAVIAPPLLRAPQAEVASSVGEVRRLRLVDGTVVTLDALSRLAMSIGTDRRLVTLLAGQAFFEVAREAGRPFLVRVGAALIRAVDGDFLVRLRPDASCAVLVRDGSVALARASDVAAGGRSVQAGWQATLPADLRPEQSAVVAPLAPRSFDRLLAWREGQLSFDGETLAEAVGQFDRYNTRRIVVPDQTLAAEPITGLFASNDPEGFARAIAVSFDARVTVRGTDLVLTRAGASPG